MELLGVQMEPELVRAFPQLWTQRQPRVPGPLVLVVWGLRVLVQLVVLVPVLEDLVQPGLLLVLVPVALGRRRVPLELERALVLVALGRQGLPPAMERPPLEHKL